MTGAPLKQYLGLLLRWQEKINLISPNTVQEAWKRHFEDSLQILPLIPQAAKTLYDLGTGAGFPGLVLAMERPDLAVTLIESDAKKCAFLQTVSRETGVNVAIRNSRIEKVSEQLLPPDVVTARALASLDQLLNYIGQWALANPDLVAIFPKGESWDKEVEKVGIWEFHVKQVPSTTEKSAAILVLTNIRKKPV